MRKIPFVAKRPIGLEPWVEFGSSESEYLKWVSEVCSIACLKSVLLARDDKAPTLWQLTKEAVSKGVFVETENGIVGAYHRPLAAWLQELGFKARPKRFLLKGTLWKMLNKHIVLLSIDLKKVRKDLDGSHLVLVYSKDVAEDVYVVHDNAKLLCPKGKSCRIDKEYLENLSNKKGVLIDASFLN